MKRYAAILWLLAVLAVLSACGALIAGDLLSAHRRTKKTVLPR